jgi:hypothetical protein
MHREGALNAITLQEWSIGCAQVGHGEVSESRGLLVLHSTLAVQRVWSLGAYTTALWDCSHHIYRNIGFN